MWSYARMQGPLTVTSWPTWGHLPGPLCTGYSVCPSRALSILLHPALCPRTLTSLGHMNSLPFFLASRWVQPVGVAGRRQKARGERGWCCLCAALVAFITFMQGDHCPGQAALSYRQVFWVLLTAVTSCCFMPRGGNSSWPRAPPGCFLSHLSSLDLAQTFENGPLIKVFSIAFWAYHQFPARPLNGTASSVYLFNSFSTLAGYAMSQHHREELQLFPGSPKRLAKQSVTIES